jgi:hypothetical protein
VLYTRNPEVGIYNATLIKPLPLLEENEKKMKRVVYAAKVKRRNSRPFQIVSVIDDAPRCSRPPCLSLSLYPLRQKLKRQVTSASLQLRVGR